MHNGRQLLGSSGTYEGGDQVHRGWVGLATEQINNGGLATLNRQELIGEALLQLGA